MEQFARDNQDLIQVIGLGTQDDFAYTQNFRDHTGVTTPTMLWDPNFATWPPFGVSYNSQMTLLNADLSGRTDLIFGFGEETRAAIASFAAKQ